MFKPTYTITGKLLGNIKRIAEVVTLLNERRFPHVVLFEMERKAREISSSASTSIEGNPLPLTEVQRILKQAPRHLRDSEREVINYNSALKRLNRLVKKGQTMIDARLIFSIHRQVMDRLLPKFSIGRFRQAPVFVNDPRAGKTVFWPPDHKDVPILMQELLKFIHANKSSIDPLVLAGLFHKQFVLIHPFMDGNGRTVRLATKMMLASMGLNTFNLFSFERFYNANVTKYFSKVGERGNFYELKIDFTPWLEYFTDGVLDELLRVQKELERETVSPATGLKTYHQLILKYLRQHGSITDSIYSTLTKRAKPTRALDLRFLIGQGLIERHGKGRATYYTLKH